MTGVQTCALPTAPRDDVGTLALRKPRRHSARRSSIFSQARQTLDRLEKQYAKEELTRAEERARLDEATLPTNNFDNSNITIFPWKIPLQHITEMFSAKITYTFNKQNLTTPTYIHWEAEPERGAAPSRSG